MNRVMTVGLDRRWRKLAVPEVVWPGDRVLDACCGTGDLAVEAERRGGRVVGLDFSERMLERARQKSGADRVGAGRRARRSRSPTASSTPPRSASACATSPTSRRSAGARPRPAAGRQARSARDHATARAPPAVLPALVRRPRSARRSGAAGRRGVHVPPCERPPLSGPDDLSALLEAPASRASAIGCSAAAASRSISGEAATP